MKEEQLQKFYAMAEPRSENAIRKAKERKMKREEKDLLLKDLCARLPHGVKIQVLCWDEKEGEINVPLTVYSVNRDGYVYFESNDYNVDYSSIEECKPYLRPMSSMTEEEHNEWFNHYHEIELKEAKSTGDYLKAAILGESVSIDWLNKNMFDFRGLIPKDLALSTEKYNPYKN